MGWISTVYGDPLEVELGVTRSKRIAHYPSSKIITTYTFSIEHHAGQAEHFDLAPLPQDHKKACCCAKSPTGPELVILDQVTCFSDS